jgi:hypothetical protein
MNEETKAVARRTNISARSAGIITITMAVYNFVKNECIYYGDMQSCLDLEFSSSDLIAIPL